MEKILEGKSLAAKLKGEVARDVSALRESTGIETHLVVILVGENEASKVYVGQKEKACAETGIRSSRLNLPASISEQDLLTRIEDLNRDPSVHGILVQLPLPPHIDPPRVQQAVSPVKDVDCFHPENTGRLYAGNPRFVPCTAAGVMALLDHYRVPLQGAEAVIVGRSAIVGRPLSLLLTARGATVTVCHSKTRDLPSHTRRADVLVAAMGRARFLGVEHVREGAVVVDVGITRLPQGGLAGDVDFEAVRDRVAGITPVPGGIGPLTVAVLMKNVLEAARLAAVR